MVPSSQFKVMDSEYAQVGRDDESMLDHRPTTITCAKEARKQAELDAQMLANRIALLKQEEEKALKKIDETRKKAEDVKARQVARQQREQKRIAHEEAKQTEIQRAMERNYSAREVSKVTRENVQRDILAKRREKVLKGKLQSEAHLNIKAERETKVLTENKQRWQEVQRTKLEGKQRQKENAARKYDSHREHYYDRIAVEDEMKAQTELLIQKMEREEMELIQRLQNTHSVQQSAMAELENTLAAASSGTLECHSKEVPIFDDQSGIRPDPAA